MNLYDQLENIKTQDDFTTFLIELQKDFKKNKDDWQNWTIDNYIESIAACLNDSNLKSENIDWKFLANIFLSGKYYE